MKKNIIYLCCAFLASMFCITNCSASRAYSIGGKFAAGTGHGGDDFTQNVDNAANAYGWISGMSSYYSHFPTISYLNSSSVFGTATVFFMNSHGAPDLMVVGSKNETDYRTGIYKGGNFCTVDNYDLVGMVGRNFSSNRLMTFAGCHTGDGSSNLVTTARNQGAQAAVGFKVDIISRLYPGTEWLKTYNYALGNGNTLQNAISKAVTAYPNDEMSQSIRVEGNSNITIGTPAKTTYMDAKLRLMSDKPINSTYKILNVDHQITVDKESIKNELDNQTLLDKIINIIKTDDLDFDINNYKLSYNLINEDDGYGMIFLTYYIDNKIETNKVYVATINNFDLESVVLAGIEKSNLSKINVSSNTLLNKINSFEQNKQTQILAKNSEIFRTTNILSNNAEIKTNELNDNIKNASESYFYDYNSEKLQYHLTYTKVYPIVTEDGTIDTFDGERLTIDIE